tara:strand:+ start:35 stop:280 length:246 start_codon:yes stop_codon:yes gene_type:complete
MEENGVYVEPDVQQQIVEEEPPAFIEEKDGGCGCGKKKSQCSKNNPEKTSNRVLFIILGVMVVGTFVYYMMKGKKAKVITE